MQTLAENPTDIEILRQAFGSEYFICRRLKNKVALDQRQQQELHDLINERNHFEILNLVTSLRKV